MIASLHVAAGGVDGLQVEVELMVMTWCTCDRNSTSNGKHTAGQWYRELALPIMTGDRGAAMSVRRWQARQGRENGNGRELNRHAQARKTGSGD